MENNFECHITMIANKNIASGVVGELGGGWTFSCIDGDPLLGNKIFCYATNHFATESDARERLSGGVDFVNKQRHLGVHVVRAKIEQVIYDVRF